MIDRYYSDFLLSVGPACRPAMNMRWNGLRDFSAPLDWMMRYSLDTILHLYSGKFKDFFIEYKEDNTKNGATGMRWVEDIKNNIISIHHFPIDRNADDVYSEFVDVMRKRARRVLERLQKAKNIVLVGNRPETSEEICKFLRSFSTIYPHLNIRFINIRHDDEVSYDEYYEHKILDEGNISYVEYSVNDTLQGVFVPEGNTFVWAKVLSKYRTDESERNLKRWIEYGKKEKIVIYGAGQCGTKVINYLKANRIYVEGIAVTSTLDNPEAILGVSVDCFKNYSKDSLMIISNKNQEDICNIKQELHKNGYMNICLVDDNMRISCL